MAELEIHHDVHATDSFGRSIGILAAILGVLLGIVTILSHRAHTEGVLLKADANDKWGQYQANRIKLHNVEVGEDILHAMAASGPGTAKTFERYDKSAAKYKSESANLMKEAEELVKESKHVEEKALRYDIGEGLIEIGVVLTSLYFISKSKLFPAIGAISAAVGIVAGISGFLL